MTEVIPFYGPAHPIYRDPGPVEPVGAWAGGAYWDRYSWHGVWLREAQPAEGRTVWIVVDSDLGNHQRDAFVHPTLLTPQMNSIEFPWAMSRAAKPWEEFPLDQFAWIDSLVAVERLYVPPEGSRLVDEMQTCGESDLGIAGHLCGLLALAAACMVVHRLEQTRHPSAA